MTDSRVTPLALGSSEKRDAWAGTVFFVVLVATLTYVALSTLGNLGASSDEPAVPIRISPRYAVAGFAVGTVISYAVNWAVMHFARKAPAATYVSVLVICGLVCIVDVGSLYTDTRLLPETRPVLLIFPIEVALICVVFLVRAKKQLPLIKEQLRASFEITDNLRWLPVNVLSIVVSGGALWLTFGILANAVNHGGLAAIIILIIVQLWGLFVWVFAVSAANTRVVVSWYTGCGAPLPPDAPIASLRRALTVQLGTHALRAAIVVVHVCSYFTVALASFLLLQLRNCSACQDSCVVRFAKLMLSPFVAQSQLLVSMDATASEAADRTLNNFKRNAALMKRMPVDVGMLVIAPLYANFLVFSAISHWMHSVDVAVFLLGAIFSFMSSTSAGVAVTTTTQTLRLLYADSVTTFAAVLPECNRLINELSGPLPAELAADDAEMRDAVPSVVVDGVVVEAVAAEEKTAA